MELILKNDKMKHLKKVFHLKSIQASKVIVYSANHSFKNILKQIIDKQLISQRNHN